MTFWFVDQDFEDFEDDEDIVDRVWVSNRHIFKAMTEEKALIKREKIIREWKDDRPRYSRAELRYVHPEKWSPLCGPFGTREEAQEAESG